MFAKSTIAIFDGSKGREYYSIHDTWANGEKSVYYDIDFPLNLALKLNRLQCKEETKQVGFMNCLNCQIYGTYKNIAMIPCWNCVKHIPEYKCDCFDGRMSFKDYVDDLQTLDVTDMTHLCCGPNCVWFASNAIYGALDTKEIGLSKLHTNEIRVQRLATILQDFRCHVFSPSEEKQTEDDELEEGELRDDELEEGEEEQKEYSGDSDDETTLGENPEDDDSDNESDNPVPVLTPYSDSESDSENPEDDEHVVAPEFTPEQNTYNWSVVEQSIIDQFSEMCDRVMRGEHE